MKNSQPQGELSELQDRRRRALVLRRGGANFTHIARTLGVHVRTVRDWWARAQLEGIEAVTQGIKRKNVPANYRLLDAKQELEIQQLILEHLPSDSQLKLPHRLWGKDAIRDLIKLRLGIDVSTRTVDTYLNRWGIKQSKPESGAVVEEDNYADLVQRAEKIEIFWAGKTMLPEFTTRKHSASSPVALVTMFYAVGNRNRLHFMIDKEQLAERASGWHLFLLKLVGQSLSRRPPRRVLLILNRETLPREPALDNWLRSMGKDIEIFHGA